jgi:ABC-type multidrug transport system ATPase subunit
VTDALIRATGLEKRFGAVTALAGVDVTVHRGETVAVVGPNGAGKSTLLRIVAGLAHPTAGRCEVAVPGDRRAAIGYLGHSSLLYPDLTARENLIFAGRLYRVRDPGARADVLLEEEGLAPVADRRAGGFSRGMAQRLSIARARVHDPPVLLLDEPYTGLDRRAADRLTARLADLASAGHTLVLVTHDIVQAGALADAVAVLVGGRLRGDWRGADIARDRLEARYLDLVGEAPA